MSFKLLSVRRLSFLYSNWQNFWVAVLFHASRHPFLSLVIQQRHQMDEVNVRDEGFTVLSGGVDPFVESVIPP